MPRLPRLALLWALPVLFLAACDTTAPPVEQPFDFERFFAFPTAAEVAAVEGEWEARAAGGAYAPGAVTAVYTGDVLGDGSTVHVLRHTTGASGAAHYGAVRVPAGEGPFPVLIVNHGGQAGFDLGEYLGLLATEEAPFGAAGVGAITVFPTFRSEQMRTPSGIPDYQSGGDPSPWDGDVDDAIALLNAALEFLGDRADPSRVATLGISRGAGVSLLMAARPLPAGTPYRIEAVSAYYGPTDFLSPVLQVIASTLLFQDGSPFEAIPGARFLQQHVLRPVLEGRLTYEEGRIEAIRRSVAYFAPRLESVQVHHHRRDAVVPFDQFESLEARRELMSGRPEFYAYGIPGPVEPRFHSFAPDVMPLSYARTTGFLNRVLQRTEPPLVP